MVTKRRSSRSRHVAVAARRCAAIDPAAWFLSSTFEERVEAGKVAVVVLEMEDGIPQVHVVADFLMDVRSKVATGARGRIWAPRRDAFG